MPLALALNAFISPVLMGVLYLITIVPAGILVQLCADPLRKRRRPGAPSYWVERRENGTPSGMSKQF
jgi:hypothetical protein